MARLRAVLILIGFLIHTLVCIPIQYVLVRLGSRAAWYFPRVYYRGVCWLLGVRVKVEGDLLRDQPVLIVSNHTSYLDIIILGSLGPIAFIAKSDVRDWAFFGILARLARTVFVERERRSRTGEHRDEIQSRLEAGEILVLFPEGTSSDGNRVLNFKSALMGAAQPPKGADSPGVAVQPVAVAYTRLNGVPMGRYFRPLFAWYGDMDLIPHLWEVFSVGPGDVTVHFYPAVTFADFGNRKAMAAYCEQAVAAGVGHALAGREGLAPVRRPAKRASGPHSPGL